MTTPKRITISNVAKQLNYTEEDIDTEEGCLCLGVGWDYDNDKLDKIASSEYRYNHGDKKKSLLWIEELKRVSNWKEGEYIYAFTKSNCDGYFRAYYKKNKIEFGWYNVIIEPSGYVCMEAFNHYTTDRDEDIKFNVFIRVESVYNDKICDKKNSK